MDKEAVLRTAGQKVAEWRRAESDALVAIQEAARLGASTREIEASTGIPYRTVARIIARGRKPSAEEEAHGVSWSCAEAIVPAPPSE